MVVFDSSALFLLLDPDAGIPIDRATGDPVERAKERIEYLIRTLSEDKTAIVVPTPALSEVLVGLGDVAGDYIAEIERSYRFTIQAFDTRAAIEVALLTESESNAVAHGPNNQTKAKVKYDRQIIGIALANGATTIYSDDDGLKGIAGRNGVRVIKSAELPLPPQDAQSDFFNDEG